MEIEVFWDMTLCWLLISNWRFGEDFCFHRQRSPRFYKTSRWWYKFPSKRRKLPMTPRHISEDSKLQCASTSCTSVLKHDQYTVQQLALHCHIKERLGCRLMTARCTSNNNCYWTSKPLVLQQPEVKIWQEYQEQPRAWPNLTKY